MQSGLIEKQCSAAIDVAEKKLEEAEDRKYRQSASVDTAADPEDARVALESGKSGHTVLQPEKFIFTKDFLLRQVRVYKNLYFSSFFGIATRMS